VKNTQGGNKKMQEQPTNNPSHTPMPASSPTAPRARKGFKKTWLVVLGLLLVLILVLAVANHNKKEPATAASAQVSITKDKFFPQTIQVKAGQSVTWTNDDSAAHWVASDPYPSNDKLPSLSSNALNNKDSYTYSFEKSGTYTYHDQLNPYKLLGTVKVE
jgi:plastocyanin